MARLSNHLGDLQDHYTVVVIGSGYGAAITASRLARAGQPVCILERGKEFQPGEYPDTVTEAGEELQSNTPAGQIGPRSGLYEFHVNEDINVFKGCGLGGTSLVNANVALRAEQRVFDDVRWPEEFRRDRETRLEEAYRHAEQMLKPNPYPEDWPSLGKLRAQETSARSMNERIYRTPINVNFTVEGPNHVGVVQHPCNLCGDCVTGCNHAAKNTLIMNYLPDAKNAGAQIFTEVDVRHVAADGDGWRVHFQPLNTGREKFDAPEMFVRADIVVIAAGALGSTEILLRSREKGLGLSPVLGERFTGNGDVLAFGYEVKETIDGCGFGHHDPAGRAPVGPCISSVIDLRERPDLEDGMVLEEGSIPGALAPIVPGTLALSSTVASEGHSGLLQSVKRLGEKVLSLVEGAYHGAASHTQTYLVMTHDNGAGKFELVKDRLRVRWPGVGDQPIFKKVDARLRQAAEALGGVFVRNPTWARLSSHPLVTVHPLGGCVMGADGAGGVVNHKGQVFRGNGREVYAGLYVNDGAVIPRSLGVNPLLTISAVAERAVQLLAEDRGWKIDYTPTSRPAANNGQTRVGIQFTETMRGFLSTRVLDDYEAAARAGEQEGSSFAFTLTIRSEDMNAMLTNPDHAASIVGTVDAPGLSAQPLTVTNGVFQLFVADPEHVRGRRMWYRMLLTGQDGQRYSFEGYKLVNDDHGPDIWRDTSTLYITLRRGEGAEAPVIGKGMLHIRPGDFATQMTTLKVLNASGRLERLKATARFGKFFAGSLWNVYGSVLERSDFGPADSAPRKRRPLRLSAPEIHPFTTGDGVDLRLTRFNGGARGPVILAPGFGTSGLAYTIDTTDTNLPEFLYARGYDVWVLDYRASPELPSSNTQFTVDDIATQDWPAAVARVREVSGAASVQVMGHCVGSLSFLMAMLAGMTGVRSAVCSQLTLFPIAPALTDVKAAMRLASLLDDVGEHFWQTDADRHKFVEEALDKFMRLYPTHEGCTSAVCRRILFLYGEVYHHANLNDPTHQAIHEMFGRANLTTLKHLTRMIQQGHVVDSQGRDVYLPNVSRLALPISFIHGGINRMFLPKGSELTYDFLREKNGPQWYTRTVIPQYAHMDCFIGRDAARDVYPVVAAELDKMN